jgi:hypothetical protein
VAEIPTPPPRRSRRWIAAVLYGFAVVAVALGAGFAARRESAARLRGTPLTGGTTAVVATEPARSDPTPAVPAKLAIGMEPPPLAPAPADDPQATPTPPTEATDEARASWAVLAVNTEPWTHVEIDGARVGTTPIVGRRVRPGRHTLKLSNPTRGISRTLVVSLREGERRRIVLDLAADGP